MPAPSSAPAQPSGTPAPLPPLELTSISPSPLPAQTAAARPAAATTHSTDRTTRMIELLLGAAVLLGVGGAYGLYATSDRR